MKVLLDNCVPHQLRTRLTGHAVETAAYRGWERLANGALLARAEPEFDVLITSDQNLRYQQNLAGRRIAIIVLPTNDVAVVLSLVPEIQQAIADAKPGGWTEIRRNDP